MRDPRTILAAVGLAPVTSRALRVCAIFGAIIAVGCGGDGDNGGEVERPTSATAERIREDGFATLRSRVAVEFPGEVNLALDGTELIDAVTLRTSGSAAEARPANLLVRSVAVSSEDDHILVIETSELVSDGTELRIQRAALQEGASGSVAVRVESDISAFDVPYATLPLVPLDPAMFSGGSRAAVATADRDATALREALDTHLRERGSSDETIERSLAAYDAMPTGVVTSPKLAAALAALVGTFAEPALDNLFSAENCTEQAVARIAFEPPPEHPELAARVTYTDAGGRVISINPDLEGESFQLLAPILAHEAIHCDREDGAVEEVAATAFDAFLYLHLLAAEPWLASETTILARNYNSDALALLNSGRVVPETVGVLDSPGGFTVLQGSDAPYRSFAQYIAAAYEDITTIESPTEELAVAYAANLAAIHGTEPQDPFNLEYLDALLGLSIPLPVRDAVVEALQLTLTP